jgi:hypothetical protein
VGRVFKTRLAPRALRLYRLRQRCERSLSHLAGPADDGSLGIPDPAAVQGGPEEIERAFNQAFQALDRRISLFLCLPLATLDTFALQKEIDEIGKK